MPITPGTWTAEPFPTPAKRKNPRWRLKGPTPDGIWTFDNPADAKVCAAAPEMLDLLKAAVARVKIANVEGNPILSGWLQDAEALITKVEG